MWGFMEMQIEDFICLSDYAYAREQILVMEKAILEKLEWYLTVPTPYVFLLRFIKASVSPDKEVLCLLYFTHTTTSSSFKKSNIN